MNEAQWNFWTLIIEASLVVKLVMLALLAASVYSWVIIAYKSKRLKRALQESKQFEKRFWSGGDLTLIYKGITNSNKPNRYLAAIFEAGFNEFSKLNSAGTPPSMVLNGAERAMRVVDIKETEQLESHLATLATIGSTSPYVGLFGTVWGIINAFAAIGQMKQVTLATVAPGIAEALIATAIGLFAAIPAVIAYNRFADKIDRLDRQYKAFIEAFSSLLNRHMHTQGAAA